MIAEGIDTPRVAVAASALALVRLNLQIGHIPTTGSFIRILISNLQIELSFLVDEVLPQRFNVVFLSVSCGNVVQSAAAS